MTATRQPFTATRRRVLGLAMLATGVMAVSARGATPAPPRIVVLGGGAGGAVAARTAKRLGGEAVSVTLVEAAPSYVTCFFSNWVIAGLRAMEDITHGYAGLAADGIAVVHGRAEAIDRDARAIRLATGETIPYDRLILAPGIALRHEAVPGYSEAAALTMPHAWKAGPQTTLLRSRLEALGPTASIVMLVPPNPYRCPPGPYERAALMAHRLKATGRAGARLTILDAKETFSKQALFQEGWERHTPGMVQWLPPSVHGGILSVDPATNSVETGLDVFSGDLITVIPPQQAAPIAVDAGLADPDGWCPVVPAAMRSPMDSFVHVIGDAAKAGEMPKSAFAAASQGRVAAVAVLADLLGWPRPEPRYFNTCWSLIAPDDGVKVGALYGEKAGGIATVKGFVSQPGEPAAERRRAVDEAENWYAAITAEMFG
ncbi:NAD(P)/FAD-dependent oxidoreductase [Mongoliimonas terrestris]|uniref:NAD(P)/FAD-dependent oxidoreductase n=1 Tax=Mongoliimonas terrestris TaxID=1709001 RepID=UPI0009494E2C|nr:NAD(P)/FAD-dependent oxidoreductase [Mongoliimonas terrestris]